jgi:hypothetical protein
MTGIEPASPAWEAGVLPMNYICTTLILYHVFWKIQVYFLIFVKFSALFSTNPVQAPGRDKNRPSGPPGPGSLSAA